MGTEPLVSVFLPTFNQENFVAEAIESALDQDYSNLQIVVGDDCSTDGTWPIVQEYVARHPHIITAYRNSRNLGITANFNELLRHCEGELVAFLAGDDIFLPGKIGAQVSLMQVHSDCCLCYHDVEVFDSDSGRVLRKWNSGERGNSPAYGSSADVARELVVRGTSFMAAVGIMVKRSAIPSWGFDQRIPVASDWLLWIEICALADGRVLYEPAALSRYRRHASNVTDTVGYAATDQLVTLALVEARYPWLRTAVRKARGYFYYKTGVRRILEGDFSEGRRDLLIGLRYAAYSYKWTGWWLYSWFNQYGRRK